MNFLKNVGLGYAQLGQPATTFSVEKPNVLNLHMNYHAAKQEKLYIFLMNQQQSPHA
jgi:excinuclease UvrABC ATPase subunit